MKLHEVFIIKEGSDFKFEELRQHLSVLLDRVLETMGNVGKEADVVAIAKRMTRLKPIDLSAIDAKTDPKNNPALELLYLESKIQYLLRSKKKLLGDKHVEQLSKKIESLAEIAEEEYNDRVVMPVAKDFLPESRKAIESVLKQLQSLPDVEGDPNTFEGWTYAIRKALDETSGTSVDQFRKLLIIAADVVDDMAHDPALAQYAKVSEQFEKASGPIFKAWRSLYLLIGRNDPSLNPDRKTSPHLRPDPRHLAKRTPDSPITSKPTHNL